MSWCHRTLVATKSLRAGMAHRYSPHQIKLSLAAATLENHTVPAKNEDKHSRVREVGRGGALHRESQIQGEGERITKGSIDQMKCAMFLFKDADLVLEL